MQNNFTAIVEKDGKWLVAYSPEFPGANGQGKTKTAAIQNLKDAIQLILTERRKDALRSAPKSAVCEKLQLA
jgi:predicted RNase H-like HicB family nuclease